MKKRKEKWIHGQKGAGLFLLVFFICAIACVLLGGGCLHEIKNPFVQKYLLAFAIALCAFTGALCGLFVWCVLSGKSTVAKSIFSLILFLIFALTVCFILQKTGFFEVVKSEEKLREYLKRAGIWMPIFYVLLQFLQVVILPIPSIVSTAAGVALFGAFWTMIYSLAGILLGSFVAFFIGRRLGNKAVSWIIGEDTLQKWQKKVKGKDGLFLTLMFVLPLFPDDILCFLAGLSSMSTRYFLIVILFSRILAISATCYSIDFIPFNTWWGLTLWLLFFIAIILAFVLLYKNMDKIQQALKKWQNKRKKMDE